MYTKQQRNEYYWKALQLLVEKDKWGTQITNPAPYMCHLLSYVAGGNIWFKNQEELLKLFPEWALFKPVGMQGFYVWDDGETAKLGTRAGFWLDIRETIFCFCIAITED